MMAGDEAESTHGGGGGKKAAAGSATAGVWAAGAVRSWISLDGSGGDGTILDVDKYAIMHRAQIHARDMRIIDPLLSYPSAILGREKAIVLNLEHIKAIITATEIILRQPSEENVIPVVQELRRRLPQGSENGSHDIEHSTEDVPVQSAVLNYLHENLLYEQVVSRQFPNLSEKALEVALEAICSFLDARTTELETAAYPALDELTTKISSRNLDRVRKIKSTMTRLIARVQKVRDELERLLDDDNDMADLHLSRKMIEEQQTLNINQSPTLNSKLSRAASRTSAPTYHGNENDVEELEMLLEAYFGQVEGTLNKLMTLREFVDDTEDYINFQLDNHRNQLIQTELFLSACAVSFTFYSLIAGIFGMNIPYEWNDEHGYMFKWVVIFGAISSALILTITLTYARYKGLIGS